MKKEKEIHASFAVIPPTAKVMATARGKSLVKMEKAFNLWVGDTDRKHPDRQNGAEDMEPIQRLQQGIP